MQYKIPPHAETAAAPVTSTWNQTYHNYQYQPVVQVTPQSTVYVNNINQKVKIPGWFFLNLFR
jgi:hypothetical protein